MGSASDGDAPLRFSAAKLVRCCAEKGISHGALARKTGFSISALSRWTNGNRRPKRFHAECLADALGLSLEDLCDKAPTGQASWRPEKPEAPRLPLRTCKLEGCDAQFPSSGLKKVFCCSDHQQSYHRDTQPLRLRIGVLEGALRAIIKTCREDFGLPNDWSGAVIGADHVEQLAKAGLSEAEHG